jgi:Ig-fold domain
MVKLDSEDDLAYSENAFDLWPGESRTVDIVDERDRPTVRLQVYTVNQFFNA